MFSFACVSCGKTLNVPENHAGQTGRCKHCGNRLIIPHPQYQQFDAELVQNQTPQSRQLASVPQGQGMSKASEYYVCRDSKSKSGPFTAPQLREMAVLGKLVPTDMVMKAGHGKWVSASQLKGLFDPLPQAILVSATPPSSAAGSSTELNFDSSLPTKPRKRQGAESDSAWGSLFCWVLVGGILGVIGGAQGGGVFAVVGGVVGMMVAVAAWVVLCGEYYFTRASDIKWQEKWEQCPSCRTLGGGEYYLSYPVDKHTVDMGNLPVLVEEVFAGDTFARQKVGEVWRRERVTRTVATYLWFYTCSNCGHKWAKIGDTDQIPLSYMKQCLSHDEAILAKLQQEHYKQIEEEANAKLNRPPG